ncbi:FeoA family protein [Solimicrobium silvestre]|uniref:Fe2+ transport system protein A n=1 Tax=Solimicrobium silvestre TaxID=2099400 RepID=A0A2S9GSU7_9BURK|nr:FeoA family protein [Solimicrobium silvestre]PRC90768.1 Fe2+ transport system protein A [Solimicrobium silvestre]
MTTSTLNLATSSLSLDQLKVGESGFVGKINQLTSAIAHHDPHLARRLMEIGFIPGEPLQVLHKGFFGGEPIAVRIGHSTFALRRFEAALISVITHIEK